MATVLTLTVNDEGDEYLAEIFVDEEIGSEEMCEVLLVALKTIDRAHAKAHAMAELRKMRN